MDTVPLELRLCESERLTLQANRTYRFTVDEDCDRCVELHNRYPIQVGDRVRIKGGQASARVMEISEAGTVKLNRFLMGVKYFKANELERI